MFNAALSRFFRKLMRNRRGRFLFIGVAILTAILTVSTVGFWFFEREKNLSLFDSLWLSYVTMSTVGYGDLYPTTTGGRILSLLVTMTGGIGIVAYIATFLATTFIEWDNKRIKGLAQVSVTDHFLIINCPNQEKVKTIIEEIRLDKHMTEVPIVLITDDLEECPQQFQEIDDFYFVRGNPLLIRVLKQANAPEAKRAIILARDTKDANSDGITTQIALTLEGLHRTEGSDIYSVAEAVSKDSVAPLNAAGVEDVICLESIISPILAQAMLNPGVAQVTEALTSQRKGDQFYVSPIDHLQERRYDEIRELFQARDDIRIIPVAIFRKGKPMINPQGPTLIEKDDKLLYISPEREDLRARLRVTDQGLVWKKG
jgi:voltage-gated potassium channel